MVKQQNHSHQHQEGRAAASMTPHHCSVSYICYGRCEAEIRGIAGKEETKLLLFTDNVIIYLLKLELEALDISS